MPDRRQNEPLLNPMFAVRGLPIAAALLLAVAMIVRQPEVHSMCVGGALGLLISSCVYSFSIRGVVLKDTPQPSDVEPFRTT